MKRSIALLVTLTAIAFLVFSGMSSALTIDSVYSSPKDVEPGKNVDITLELRNDMNTNLEEITVSLDLTNLPFAPYGSSNEFFVDKIKEDKTKDVTFSLITLSDAKSGVYKVPVRIKYTADEEKVEKIETISISVNSRPILSVESEGEAMIKGQNSEISLKIVNKGLEDVKFLEVEIETTSLVLLSPEIVYIGNLDSDDFDTASYDIYAGENSLGIASALVHLRYRDSNNVEYTETKNIDLRLYSKEEAIRLGLIKQSNATTIILIVVALVVLYVIYRIVRGIVKRRRQQRKSQKP